MSEGVVVYEGIFVCRIWKGPVHRIDLFIDIFLEMRVSMTFPVNYVVLQKDRNDMDTLVLSQATFMNTNTFQPKVSPCGFCQKRTNAFILRKRFFSLSFIALHIAVTNLPCLYIYTKFYWNKWIYIFIWQYIVMHRDTSNI